MRWDRCSDVMLPGAIPETAGSRVLLMHQLKGATPFLCRYIGLNNQPSTFVDHEFNEHGSCIGLSTRPIDSFGCQAHKQGDSVCVQEGPSPPIKPNTS